VLDAWDNPVAMGLNQDPLYSIEAEGALLTVGEGPAGAPPPTANDKFSRKSTHCNAAREHIVPTIRFRALPTATAARLRVKCEVNVGGTPGGGGGMPRVGGSRLELVAALELELVSTNRVVQVFTTPRAAEYAAVSCRAGDRPGKVTPQPSPWLPLTLVPVFVVGSTSIFIQWCRISLLSFSFCICIRMALISIPSSLSTTSTINSQQRLLKQIPSLGCARIHPACGSPAGDRLRGDRGPVGIRRHWPHPGQVPISHVYTKLKMPH
jgi:hypothetical protein